MKEFHVVAKYRLRLIRIVQSTMVTLGCKVCNTFLIHLSLYQQLNLRREYFGDFEKT